MALSKPKTIFLDPKAILSEIELKSGYRVADLGCGGGYFVLEAAREIGDQGIAYGVDILQSALSAVASRARLYGLFNVRTVWSNAEIPGGANQIKDHSLDAVLMVQLFSQSKRHQNIFTEATRLVKPTGQLLVVDWRPDHNYKFGPPSARCVAEDKIKDIASQHGWKCTKTFDAGPYHFGMVFSL